MAGRATCTRRASSTGEQSCAHRRKEEASLPNCAATRTEKFRLGQWRHKRAMRRRPKGVPNRTLLESRRESGSSTVERHGTEDVGHAIEQLPG
jgi:hypothetical protein